MEEMKAQTMEIGPTKPPANNHVWEIDMGNHLGDT